MAGSIKKVIVAASFLILLTSPVLARGGRGGGGGMRGGGGGGGMRGGGFSGARSPSFSSPRPSPGMGARPGGGGGGVARPGGPAMGTRPGGAMGGAPGMAGRPGGGQVGRPGGGPVAGRPGPGGAGRPSTLPSGPGTSSRPGAAGGGIANRPGIDSRPGIGQGGGIANRPGIDSRPGSNNRPPFDNNTGNRAIAGNRTNIGQDNLRQGNINVSNRQNNFLNRPVDPGYGVRPPAYNNWRGQYWNNHRSWVNGYWHGYHNGNNWNWGSFALGAASGVAAWGLGSSLYSWGYSGYSNPYYDAGAMAVAPVGAVDTQAVPATALTYDYSQPINAEAPPPEQPVTDAALATFDSARASFKAGQYADALQFTEQALNKLPNDATLHEFRGLCLFALGKFEQAAVPLYAVLSVGPGWDWTTLAGLYPSVDVYTQQLRTLEAYTKSNAPSAAGHFVLGYFYLTQGSMDQAVSEFQRVVSLSPSDTLSAQLVKQFSRPVETSPASPTSPSPTQNVTLTESNLAGNWKAKPTKETTISLTIQDSGLFTWEVTTKGQSQQIAGDWSLAGNVLTLAENEQKGALVGNVSSQAPNSFVFRVIGAGPSDSGLSFTR